MAFNNRGNRVALWGWVSSNISSPTDYAVEFTIAVPRKTAQGERTFVDQLTVYANQRAVCDFCKTHLQLNMRISVKGEIRKFYNGDIKICSDDITVSTNKKKI